MAKVSHIAPICPHYYEVNGSTAKLIRFIKGSRLSCFLFSQSPFIMPKLVQVSIKGIDGEKIKVYISYVTFTVTKEHISASMPIMLVQIIQCTYNHRLKKFQKETRVRLE